VQRALLPAVPPDRSGVRFAWDFRPCTELAGNLLNVFPLDEPFVGLYLLDASSHGAAAALLSATVGWALTRLARGSWLAPQASRPSPGEVVARLAREFPWDPRTEQYFSLLYGVLDLTSREFRFTSAGHPGPAYLPRGGQPTLLGGEHGHAIGVGLGEGTYGETALVLRPGDRLCLYSDGVTEARSADGKSFGAAGLLRRLDERRDEPLPDALAAVVRAAEAWSHPSPPHDDVALLGVEVAEGR
jgi:sigma-B regulation protein RsbU (phosphoserine phosphatase)